jgi:hypothetical protein
MARQLITAAIIILLTVIMVVTTLIIGATTIPIIVAMAVIVLMVIHLDITMAGELGAAVIIGEGIVALVRVTEDLAGVAAVALVGTNGIDDSD